MLHRSIMLHAEDRIHVLITRLRESAAPPERQALLDELTEIEASVHEVAHSVVDYQHVMDELDDNILVADKDEVVLYVNDAYIRHTGIAPEQILGKRITELLETGTYFTDPTVPEVIRSRKKVMKLSSMFGRPDSLGFVTGVPIFDDAGEIQYVVAFGYERGSFSGANASGKQGLFEAANNGTLFLDEIGEMPMDMQAKLLRAIQNNEITRVGGIRPIKLDIRYIASTNCDLKKKVREGTFRSDLYYRLHVIPIQVPPLREREGDVARLSQHFVSEFNKQYHKNVVLSPENIELLENYSWPGNIRELRNVMEYLVVCCAPNGHVDNSYIYGTFDLSNQNAYVEYDPDQSLNDAITAYEKKYLENALRYARNLKEASQILNIDPSTVSRKLRQHGLTLQGK